MKNFLKAAGIAVGAAALSVVLLGAPAHADTPIVVETAPPTPTLTETCQIVDPNPDDAWSYEGTPDSVGGTIWVDAYVPEGYVIGATGKRYWSSVSSGFELTCPTPAPEPPAEGEPAEEPQEPAEEPEEPQESQTPVRIEWGAYNPADVGVNPCDYETGETFTLPESEGYIYTVFHDEVGNSGFVETSTAPGYTGGLTLYFEFRCETTPKPQETPKEAEQAAPVPTPEETTPVDVDELAATGPADNAKMGLAIGGGLAILAGILAVIIGRRKAESA